MNKKKKKMDVIISLGGSMIVPGQINTLFLKQFIQAINNHVKKNNRVVIICGGGHTCRVYQNAARNLGVKDNQELDWIGIKATILNARFVQSLFSKKLVHEEIITNPTKKITTKKKIIIGSGWKPGCSSDHDAVLLAKNLHIKTIINLTNVDYVYTKDPKKFKDAKKIKKICWKHLQDIVGTKWIPGANVPFDPIATKEAKKHSFKLYIVKGTVQNIKNILDGKKVKGTIVE